MNSVLDSLPNLLLDQNRELPSVDDVLEALDRYREATEDRMTPPFVPDDSDVDSEEVEASDDSEEVQASGDSEEVESSGDAEEVQASGDSEEVESSGDAEEV
ncbi:MAG: hypothetical protein VX938_11535, partial [Myxococcota bacterium]|nr:hypothetical protein [Myxococcota bacterium]